MRGNLEQINDEMLDLLESHGWPIYDLRRSRIWRSEPYPCLLSRVLSMSGIEDRIVETFVSNRNTVFMTLFAESFHEVSITYDKMHTSSYPESSPLYHGDTIRMMTSSCEALALSAMDEGDRDALCKLGMYYLEVDGQVIAHAYNFNFGAILESIGDDFNAGTYEDKRMRELL